MTNEHKRLILAIFLMMSLLFRLVDVFVSMCLIVFLFLEDTCPLLPISKGIKNVLKPAFIRSLFNGVYRMIFFLWATSTLDSKLHVSSIKKIILVFLLMIKMSGLCMVMNMSVGIVSPFIL